MKGADGYVPPKREPNRRSTHTATSGSDPDRFTTNATWCAVPDGELEYFVRRVTDLGGSVLLSKSADGGVLSITVMAGDTRWRSHPRSADECLRAFTDILADID